MLHAFKDLKEIIQNVHEDLSPDEDERMIYKGLSVFWAMGGGAMAVEAGVDWAAKGTPINTQTIGATALALILAGGSAIFNSRGQASQETAPKE